MESEKDKLKDVISLLLEIESIDKRSDVVGKDIHGNCFEFAHLNDDGTITMHTESGHDWECDEWNYDANGNEIIDEE